MAGRSVLTVASDLNHSHSSRQMFLWFTGGGSLLLLSFLLVFFFFKAESALTCSALSTQLDVNVHPYFSCSFADSGSSAELQVLWRSRQSGGLLQGAVSGSPCWCGAICVLHQGQHPPCYQVTHTHTQMSLLMLVVVQKNNHSLKQIQIYCTDKIV